jgi:hypothetical protein
MTSPTIEEAREKRLLVAITFHYDAARLSYLAGVMHALSEFAVADLDVIIVTNTFFEEHVAVLRRLCAEVLPHRSAVVRSYGNLAHPFDLSWCHKAIITHDFIVGTSAPYSHFVYLEDDIQITFANFCYFLEFRQRLRPFGLLPSFLRMEFSSAFGGFVASDAFWPIYVPVQPHILLGDVVCVNVPNPYNPCFVLDTELAKEYMQSKSFDRERSEAVCRWGTRERAAMGLCLENVPPQFQTRYVVPVSRATDMVPAFARIWHLPNNYANDPQLALGKIRLDQLSLGARELSYDRWQSNASTEPSHWTESSCWEHQTDLENPGTVQPHVKAVEFTSIETSSFRAKNEAPDLSSLYYLVSAHDTIVYMDADAQRVRHGPFGTVPLNLVLQLAGSMGRLLIKDDHVKQISFSEPAGVIPTKTEHGHFDCQIETFPDNTIGIRLDERYLSADMDRLAKCDRISCQRWERFQLIRADTCEGLAILRRYSWITDSDRRIVTLGAQPMGFDRDPVESSALAATLAANATQLRREMVFGPARFDMTARGPLFTVRPGQGGAPLEIELLSKTGTAHRFRRFTPLVHYCVYGDETYCERLRLSLTSLAKYGCFGGTVAITSDRAFDELAEYVPHVFRDRLIATPASKNDNWLMDPRLRLYQPILFCNVDVIFDASVSELLIDVLLSTEACCLSETPGPGREKSARIWATSHLGTEPRVQKGLVDPGIREIGHDRKSDILAKYCRVSRAPAEVPVDGRRGLTEFRLNFQAARPWLKTTLMRSYLQALDHQVRKPRASAEIKGEGSLADQIDLREVEITARLARNVQPNGCIVDISSSFNLLSWTLATNKDASVAFYGVNSQLAALPGADREPHPDDLTFESFRDSVREFPKLFLLSGDSPRDFVGWQRGIDLLFVARTQSNPRLRTDLNFWSHFVRIDGLICGHGYCSDFADIKEDAQELAAGFGVALQVTGTIWSVTVPNKIETSR